MRRNSKLAALIGLIIAIVVAVSLITIVFISIANRNQAGQDDNLRVTNPYKIQHIDDYKI